MLRQFSPSAKKFSALQSLAYSVQNASDVAEAARHVRMMMLHPLFQSKGWQSVFAKLANYVSAVADNGGDDATIPPFTVFAEGNSKLPFYAFSTLPGVTCPGAGECLQYCYSFTAWRYPAAFARQLQNAFLMRFHKLPIVNSWAKLPHNAGFTFRLYVDGDFAKVSDVAFWFDLLKSSPTVKAYGYSKSFDVLLTYANMGNPLPTNYMLNVSNGHNATASVVFNIKALPITRGEFRAVSIGRKVKSSEHGSALVNRALREASDDKVFPCPGKCGSCTGAGHACGLPQMKGKVIAIAVH
jgi:hypothetical protein